VVVRATDGVEIVDCVGVGDAASVPTMRRPVRGAGLPLDDVERSVGHVAGEALVEGAVSAVPVRGLGWSTGGLVAVGGAGASLPGLGFVEEAAGIVRVFGAVGAIGVVPLLRRVCLTVRRWLRRSGY
jgi:hypothetical protein